MSDDITTDAVRYTEQVLGVTVFDYQKPALETTANVTTGVGGRRSGKTLISQAKSCHTAMAKRGRQIIITSANEGSVRRWISEAADLIAASKIAREATINIEALRIEFSNGSELRGVPPTSSALRGYGRRVAGVVIDEGSLCAPTLWQDARYLLLDNIANGAWAFMVGPPSCSPTTLVSTRMGRRKHRRPRPIQLPMVHAQQPQARPRLARPRTRQTEHDRGRRRNPRRMDRGRPPILLSPVA